MTKQKQTATVTIPLPQWVALCTALEAAPDTDPATLALKARRLAQSRTKYAREVIELEQRLIEKCPDIEK